MFTEESKREKTALPPAGIQVLAALGRVPMDKTRLFKFVYRNDGQPRVRTLRESHEASPVVFLDTLAILQADGLITRTAHPLETRRVYYLTQKGSELAKGGLLRVKTAQRQRVRT